MSGAGLMIVGSRDVLSEGTLHVADNALSCADQGAFGAGNGRGGNRGVIGP